jgi:hypothetical protein
MLFKYIANKQTMGMYNIMAGVARLLPSVTASYGKAYVDSATMEAAEHTVCPGKKLPACQY